MEASVRNMRDHYGNGVFAYSPATGEEHSADPDDYWPLADDHVLKDGDGEPMILAIRCIRIIELGEENA